MVDHQILRFYSIGTVSRGFALRYATSSQCPRKKAVKQGATGDANPFPGASMTNSNDGHPSPLPDEFAAALRRATDRTLQALQSLRQAVRQHVQDEHSRGVSLEQIDADLLSMIEAAAGDPARNAYSVDRNEELTSQVLKWTAAFYSGDRHRGNGIRG